MRWICKDCGTEYSAIEPLQFCPKCRDIKADTDEMAKRQAIQSFMDKFPEEILAKILTEGW